MATEAPIYGSSRVGVWNKSDLAEDNQNDLSVFNRLLFNNRGRKFYEISNHLGNVLTTISDKKMPHNNGSGIADYYTTDVVSATDYYPFGMQSRYTYTGSLALNYRFGFNGKENDNDVKGEGMQQDYGERIYDPRLARFLSTDLLTQKFPDLTPYQFASNCPIAGIDLDGLEFFPRFKQNDPLSLTAWSSITTYKKSTIGKIVNGSAAGIKASATKTFTFFTSDVFKSSTYKNAGAFFEEAIWDMSTVKVSESPRLDALAKDFEANVINGDAYTRSKYITEFGADALTAYISGKGLGNISSFVANTVKTDFAIARQSLRVGALKAAAEAKSGATLYRIGTTGISAQGEAAQYWSLENPLINPEAYARKYNVPLENIKNADFIETANLKKGANFITRGVGEAPGSINTGKGIEVVVEKSGTTNNLITPIKKP